MKDIREWFKDGAGRFSRQEFLTENLKRNVELKAAIIEVIDRRKSELRPVLIDEELCTWSTQEHFAKVLTQRNYTKKTHLEIKEKISHGKGAHVLYSSPKTNDGSVQSREFYVPSLEELDNVVQVESERLMEELPNRMLPIETLKDIVLTVTMFVTRLSTLLL
ncbi:hypothetical protein GOP47_0023935 [Adiantum capillus-veneris]|uniref:Uncharacterized protein n=1 Tax=Adiantum capillus-veneris TaxID=13818 RepID=A0A9D4U4Y2_ADICA|nr:hypothetical protein GOP47_0023935 [Adiantum capillus-veneris]